VTTWVLDTSVVVKWFLDEPDSERAEPYLEALELGGGDVVVPSSLPYEVGNTLWVRRRDALDRQIAGAMLDRFLELPLHYVPAEELLAASLAIAYDLEVSPYDGVFVALAEKLDCKLITADRSLWKRTCEEFPRVELL
jgi:predicted nucleic acid-binding protein